MNQLKYKHALIGEVLALFRARKPVERVNLMIYVTPGEAMTERHRFSLKRGPSEPMAVLIGEFVHVGVSFQRPGFLHLFNLGTTGDVSTILSGSDPSGPWIESGGTFYLTRERILTSVVEQSCGFREAGDGDWDSLGEANGYPERLLAVMTTEATRLEPRAFHDQWDVYGMNRRSVQGWAAIQDGRVNNPSFWDRPDTSWEWGYFELTVKHQQTPLT